MRGFSSMKVLFLTGFAVHLLVLIFGSESVD
jgi:hypothetical protein